VLTFLEAAFPAGAVSHRGGAPPLASSLLDAPIEIIGELRADPLVVAFSLDALRQAAFETRPDVQAAQRSSDAAQRHRDLDVAVEYQRNGDNTVGATVSFPSFSPTSLRAHINSGLGPGPASKRRLRPGKITGHR